MSNLIYVTSPDCHLCDHGRTVLDELKVERRELQSDSPEALELATKGIALAFLPVLTDGNRVIAYGRFSAKRLARDLGFS